MVGEHWWISGMLDCVQPNCGHIPAPVLGVVAFSYVLRDVGCDEQEVCSLRIHRLHAVLRFYRHCRSVCLTCLSDVGAYDYVTVGPIRLARMRRELIAVLFASCFQICGCICDLPLPLH